MRSSTRAQGRRGRTRTRQGRRARLVRPSSRTSPRHQRRAPRRPRLRTSLAKRRSRMRSGSGWSPSRGCARQGRLRAVRPILAPLFSASTLLGAVEILGLASDTDSNPSLRSVVKPSLVAGLVSPGLARTGPPPLDRLSLDDSASLLASPPSSPRLEPLAELSRPRRRTLDVSVPLGARPVRRRPRLESPADAGQVALRLAAFDSGTTPVADAGALGPASLAVDLGVVVERAGQPLSLFALARPPAPLSPSVIPSERYSRIIPRSWSPPVCRKALSSSSSSPLPLL